MLLQFKTFIRELDRGVYMYLDLQFELGYTLDLHDLHGTRESKFTILGYVQVE